MGAWSSCLALYTIAAIRVVTAWEVQGEMLGHIAGRRRSQVAIAGIAAVSLVVLLFAAGAAGRPRAPSVTCAARWITGMGLPSDGEGFYGLRGTGMGCAAVGRAIGSGQLHDDGAFRTRGFACASRSAPFQFLWYESYTPSFPGFRYSCRSSTRRGRGFAFGWNAIHYCPALTSDPAAPTFERSQSFSRYMSCRAIDAAERSATVEPGRSPGSPPKLNVPGFNCLETLILAAEDAVRSSPPYAVHPTRKVFGVTLGLYG